MKNITLYNYRAVVVSVYDGDTCRADIDLGLGIWVKNEKIRLSRIDAPEIRGDSREFGIKSRDYLRKLILGKSITIQTTKDKKGKYGRYLGEIWLRDDSGEYRNINDEMVTSGFAEYKSY